MIKSKGDKYSLGNETSDVTFSKIHFVHNCQLIKLLEILRITGFDESLIEILLETRQSILINKDEIIIEMR
jgi:uncharacterized protein with PIN domain